MDNKEKRQRKNENGYVSLTPDRGMYLRVVGILCFVLLLVVPYLLYKLADVQIIHHEEYQSRAISQQVRSVTL
ncbi:MAG: hypothetical protein IKZ21_00355, partial [Clostridia bacterium]|nr:hypothetical protein [Clostridia bacterium]